MVQIIRKNWLKLINNYAKYIIRKNMERIRKADEDYLEAILILEKENQIIQSVKIAKMLGVSRAAVSKEMNALLQNKLIEKTSYGKITLTDQGRNIALKTYSKHLIIKDFLVKLGVSEENAEHDCCIFEHTISDETINKMKEFTYEK